MHATPRTGPGPHGARVRAAPAPAAPPGRKGPSLAGGGAPPLLRTLAAAPGRVFSRQALLEELWGSAAWREPRTIDVHVRHLREKLERSPSEPEYIFTVRGVGYRFRDR